MTVLRYGATVATLLLGLGLTPLSSERSGGFGFTSSAQAQMIRNLIARLRGETLPAGVVKSNGRIEATQVDVSSKYAGRLAEVTVRKARASRKGR